MDRDGREELVVFQAKRISDERAKRYKSVQASPELTVVPMGKEHNRVSWWQARAAGGRWSGFFKFILKGILGHVLKSESI